MLDELVHLLEGAFVEQEFDPLTDRKFAFAVLALAALDASAFLGGGMAAAEFIETIHQSSEYRATPRWLASHTRAVFHAINRWHHQMALSNAIIEVRS